MGDDLIKDKNRDAFLEAARTAIAYGRVFISEFSVLMLPPTPAQIPEQSWRGSGWAPMAGLCGDDGLLWG